MSAAIPRKWCFDLNVNRSDLNSSYDPIGFNRNSKLEITASKADHKDADKTTQLKQKRAMEIAWAPGKNLFMTAFMMWMSGSSINIFSIMITGMSLFNPIKAAFGVNQAFAGVADGKVDLMQAKIIFLFVNAIGLVMALYKCGTLGLLPTTSADWTWLLPTKQLLETSAAAITIS